MNRKIITTLMWKEWHEQRWKLAFCTLLLTALVAIGLKTRLLPDDVLIVFGVMIGAVLLPIFVAMDMIAPERTDKTLNTLLVLPAVAWQIFAVKMFVGMLSCAAPFVGSALIATLFAAGREITFSNILRIHFFALVIALLLLIWTIAFSVRQASEARAGLVGIAVMCFWALASIIGSEFIRSAHFLWTYNPLRFFELATYHLSPTQVVQQIAHLIIFNAGFAVLLGVWAAIRFSKLPRTNK